MRVLPRTRARSRGAVLPVGRAAVVLAVGVLGAALAGCQADLDDVQGAAAARDAHAERTADAPDAGGSAGTPLPDYDAASAVGDLVDGFPSDLVTIPPGARVLASSARQSADGALVDVTLNLRSEDPVETLTAFYTDALGAAGFEVSPSTVPSALTSLTTFVRASGSEGPTESLAVGVFDDETERLVTISGQVAAG